MKSIEVNGVHRVLNLIKDTPDTRDFKFVRPMGIMAVASHSDLRPSSPPIYDQGQFGSCTAQAWTRLIEFIQLVHIKKNIPGPEEFGNGYTQLARLFFYFNERRVRGTTAHDAGAMLRDGMVAARKWGVCRESIWPYNSHDLLTRPPDVCYSEGLKHLITQAKMVRITDGDIDGMRACLASGTPIVFGKTLTDSFMRIRHDGIAPDSSGKIVGGHAMTLVGHDDKKKMFTVANSWGTGFGDKGHVYISYKEIGNPQITSDFWTVTI